MTALDSPVGISAWHTSTARPLGVATIRALSVNATKGGTPFRSIPQPMSRSTMAPGFALAIPAGTATVSNTATRINGTSSLLPMIVSLALANASAWRRTLVTFCLDGSIRPHYAR